MTGVKQCALCNENKDLKNSHIIPSFVYKWLKSTSVTGRFRHGETPNKRIQDGDKIYLLCKDCEQLFSGWERTFSEEVFTPFNEGGVIKPYGNWLLKFSTSISWRVLTFFKKELDLNHFPDNLMNSVDTALQTWKEFLLNKRPHPARFEQHILPFPGLIKNHSDPKMPSNINRYITRSIDIAAASSENAAFTYAKLGRIILIGFIEMPNPNHWHHTKIHVNRGNLAKKHYKAHETFRNFMYYQARKAQNSMKKISDKQWDRISEDYEKQSDKYRASEMFKAMTHDFILFGDAAFDDVRKQNR